MCKHIVTAGRGKNSLLLGTVLLFVFAFVLLGCKNEKETALLKTRGTGPCEVYDKLPGDIAKPLGVNYGGKVKLVGITANKTSQDKLKVSYYWETMDDLGAFNEIFVHFTDKDNKILFQNDHVFCQRKPFNELKGKVIKEPYVIAIPQSAAGKEIYVKAGVYAPDLGLGERLKIESSGGILIDDAGSRAIVEKLGL